MNTSEILVIDDEPQIQKLLQIALESQGYKVSQAETGRAGIVQAANQHPDVILLDIALPDMSGQEVLRELRSWYRKSIIMLSVNAQEADIVTALDNGASDYLTKPFRTAELMARIRSAIRRDLPANLDTVLHCRDLQIDLIARTVHRDGEFIKLTNTEFNLLALFVQNEGRALTHQYILREVWGTDFQQENQYLRVFVGTLRKKIEKDSHQPQHILTENGVGYRFQ